MFSQLGTTVFEALKTPTSFSIGEGAVFAEHSLINSKPRLQFTGVKLKEISIGMKLHASFCNIENELTAIREQMESGGVVPLLWGTGKLEGKFVILDVNTELEETDISGNKISVELSVNLKEFYVKDPINKKQQEAKKNAFATGNKRPPNKSKRVNPTTCEQTVSNIISAIKSRAKQVSTVALAYTNVGRQHNDIMMHLSYMKNNTSRLISICQTAGSCASQVPELESDAKNLLSECEFYSKADPANIAGVKSENNILQNRVKFLERTATPLIKKAATRHG